MREIKQITIHCSDTDSGSVDSIRKNHIEKRGFIDIGYHYVITKTGEIQTGRNIEIPGAHCPEANRDSVGICLIGKKDFSQEQIENLINLIFRLKEHFGSLAVKGHYEFASAKKQGKTCPNIDMDKFRKEWSLWA